MAQQTNKVVVTFDRESRLLLQRIAVALEKANTETNEAAQAYLNQPYLTKHDIQEGQQ